MSNRISGHYDHGLYQLLAGHILSKTVGEKLAATRYQWVASGPCQIKINQ